MGSGTNSPKMGTATENKKRKASKQARGFGIGAMEKLGVDPTNDEAVAVWTQKSDPLFKVKGIERTIRMKEFK